VRFDETSRQRELALERRIGAADEQVLIAALEVVFVLVFHL
jgi:hypothetical protein